VQNDKKSIRIKADKNDYFVSEERTYPSEKLSVKMKSHQSEHSWTVEYSYKLKLERRNHVSLFLTAVLSAQKINYG
jgi:hypothetical protein